MFDIVLHQNNFGDGDVQQTVNGRDIHSALDVGKQYSTWVQDQIAFHKFSHNINYIKVLPEIGKNPAGGRPATEYHFTLESAKHIALTSRTEKGRAYRQALIDLEKRVASSTRFIEKSPTQQAIELVDGWKRLAELCGAPVHIALIEASKETRKLGVEISPLLQLSSYMDNIRADEEMLEPTELAKRLGYKSGQAMNKCLAEMGLQARINGEWVPTDTAAGMYSKHSWEKGGKSGYNLKWNVKKVEARLRAYTETYDHSEV